MRQAGRYLPEYCATRAKAGSFTGLATNTDYATEVTLQPLERYAPDAAILFSDILTVPDAMGLGLSFAIGEGPKFARTVSRAEHELASPNTSSEPKPGCSSWLTRRRHVSLRWVSSGQMAGDLPFTDESLLLVSFIRQSSRMTRYLRQSMRYSRCQLSIKTAAYLLLGRDALERMAAHLLLDGLLAFKWRIIRLSVWFVKAPSRCHGLGSQR
jgi:hypothetical protein